MHFLELLTLNLLTTTIVAPPSNASKWQTGFNSVFKGLNTELHFSVGIQTQRKPHNTGYEPVRKATVAWTTRITSYCQCSNAGHVMVCNCSDTDTY